MSPIKQLVRKLIAGLVAVAVLTLGVLHYGVLPWVDGDKNRVLVDGPYPASARARALHEAAFVADLHADALLWGRNLRERHGRGHVDLPRLREGGVDLQVFGVVTKVPRDRNYRRNRADSDVLPLLFLAAWRPPQSWFSPKARALVQAAELRRLAERSDLGLVLRRSDLEAGGPKGLLALEGMHALEGDGAALDELYAAGFRMMGLAHFFDNAVAGSVHGERKGGLTALGRALVPRMEALGITVDVAHAAPAAIDEVLAMATRPVVYSHGGVQGTCPGPRNLSDAQLRGIAATGGVVGIGYWQDAICAPSVAGIVAAVRHAAAVAGIDHVGLGSDFDGSVATPFDTTGLPMLTQALLAAGLSEGAVAKVLGGNVRRVLARNLPQ